MPVNNQADKPTDNPSDNRAFETLKSILGSGPQQGWAFGVCANLAKRTGWDLWAVRAVALVALLLTSILSIFSYFALAMLMHETRPAAQQKMRRWAGQLDKVFDLISRGVKQFFASQPKPRDGGTRQQWQQDYRA